jgi:hypothetical protein
VRGPPGDAPQGKPGSRATPTPCAMAKRKPSEAIKAVVDAGQPLNVGELAESMVGAFGGPKKLAKLFFDEFNREGTASMARTKMLEAVLRIVTQASAQEAKNKVPGEEELSDDELQGEIVRLLTKQGLKVVAADGPEQPAG